MKVTVLKGFPIAIDEYGVKTRDLIANTDDDIPDELFESLRAEGYVTAMDEPAAHIRIVPHVVEVVPPVDEQVEIPTDWKVKHWTQRVALAKRLLGGEGDLSTAEADEVIADEVKRRAADKAGE